MQMSALKEPQKSFLVSDNNFISYYHAWLQL